MNFLSFIPDETYDIGKFIIMNHIIVSLSWFGTEVK